MPHLDPGLPKRNPGLKLANAFSVKPKLHQYSTPCIIATNGILVLSSLLMISTEFWTGPCSGRPIILLGVIACLCFSVGEGLRLRPFPLSALAEAETTDTQLHATASYEISLRKYGPLDVPTRVQNRGKRQVVDFGNAATQNSREITVHQVLISSADEPADNVSLLFGSHLSGRAPPLDS